MLYRVIDALSFRGETIPAGIVSPLRELSDTGIRALLRTGVIAEISAPPLAVLGPVWAWRAERLREVEITDIAALIAAEHIEGLEDDVLEQWQNEALAILEA